MHHCIVCSYVSHMFCVLIYIVSAISRTIHLAFLGHSEVLKDMSCLSFCPTSDDTLNEISSDRTIQAWSCATELYSYYAILCSSFSDTSEVRVDRVLFILYFIIWQWTKEISVYLGPPFYYRPFFVCHNA
jgi:hypothetical protein